MSFSSRINSFNPKNLDENINRFRLLLILLFYCSNYCASIYGLYGMAWMNNTNLSFVMTLTMKHSIFGLKSLSFFIIHVDISSRRSKNSRWMPRFISTVPNSFFSTTYFYVFLPLTCLISSKENDWCIYTY